MLATILSAALVFTLPKKSDDFVARHNEFALRVLRVVAKDPGNSVLSPYSVAVAMAMAREGARGETARELDLALGLPEGGAGARFAELAKLLPMLGSDARTDSTPRDVSIANAMWGQTGYKFEASFLQRLSTGFGAHFFTADFIRRSNDAREAINAWVLEQTRERIKDLLPAGEPTPDSRLVLVNAIWMKAAWEQPFQASLTRPVPFYAPNGEVAAPTMLQTQWCWRTQSRRADVVALPYTDGLEMLIVLPNARDGLADVIANESVADWTAKRKTIESTVWLPKFTFAQGTNLIPALQELGIALAFDSSSADFGGISPLATRPDQRLFIGVVRQKAWIAVDEQGTEAAAATEVGLRCGAAIQQTPPREFKVDHPFLFVIRHVKTGLVLFTGRVDDPTAK